LGSMTGFSYTLDDVTVIVPELSGFRTMGACTRTSESQTKTIKDATTLLLPPSHRRFLEES
jgi:hypothetical protein